MDIPSAESDCWTPRQVMPKVGGASFCCKCGCNVFTEYEPLRYSCNSCGLEYAGESKSNTQAQLCVKRINWSALLALRIERRKTCIRR